MTDYKEYIYAIYQEKSFSKAAKKLYVSQPWLSATVKKVGQQLQIPLLYRSTNPISLTDAGRYYIGLLYTSLIKMYKAPLGHRQLKPGMSLMALTA